MYDDASMQIFQILTDIEPLIIGCFHHLGRKRKTILSLERIKQSKQDWLTFASRFISMKSGFCFRAIVENISV